MNLTTRQQFGVLASVLRQPTLRESPKIARCLFERKKTFTEPRAHWLATELVLSHFELERVKASATHQRQAWFFDFWKLAEEKPSEYSLPGFLAL